MRTLVVGLVLFLSIPSRAQVRLLEVRVDAAHVRDGPSIDTTSLAVLHQGDIREIVGDVPYWFEILLGDGRSGFIAKRLTTVMVDTEVIEDFEDELAEPLDELYEIPPHATTVTLPGCTPRSSSRAPRCGPWGRAWL